MASGYEIKQVLYVVQDDRGMWNATYEISRKDSKNLLDWDKEEKMFRSVNSSRSVAIGDVILQASTYLQKHSELFMYYDGEDDEQSNSNENPTP